MTDMMKLSDKNLKRVIINNHNLKEDLNLMGRETKDTKRMRGNMKGTKV